MKSFVMIGNRHFSDSNRGESGSTPPVYQSSPLAVIPFEAVSSSQVRFPENP